MLAHITISKDGIEKYQSLKEHCLNTAQIAKKSVKGTGFEGCAYFAGILRDMGKAKKEFQEYLNKSFKCYRLGIPYCLMIVQAH